MIFRRRREQNGVSAPDTQLLSQLQTALADIERLKAAVEGQLEGFDSRLDAFKERVESIDYEWTDWYDKFRRLHARLARRQQRAEESEEEQPTEGSADAIPPTPPSESQATNPLALRLMKGM